MIHPKVNPGELRHWVDIQAKSKQQDDSGQQVEAWSTVLRTRCKIEGVSRIERYGDAVTSEQVDHLLTTRVFRQVTITPGMRAVFRDHYYYIKFLDNLQEQDWVMLLYCLELNGSES
jgi:SPP1 family predicted phage head-tail adaptor